MNSMTAVRWLKSEPCGYMFRELGAETFTPEESALWEMNPTREVCVEIMPTLEQSGHEQADVGLLVDQSLTALVRVYAEDVWSELQEDGVSVRAPGLEEADELALWNSFVSSGWENARKVYDSIPAEEREGWAEGIIAHPVYSAIVVKKEKELDMDGLLKLWALEKVFGLPIIRIV